MDWFLSYWAFLPLFFLSLVSFTLYYHLVVISPVLFFGQKNKGNEALKKALRPILESKYRPTFWCFESRMQTLMAWLFRISMPDNEYRREVLRLHDGGEVVLDWMDNNHDDSKVYNGPILLLLPGLTGNSQSYYIKKYKIVGARMGAKCVTFNYRGCGGHALRTPRTYCAGNVDDLADVVEHIKHCYPNSKLVAVGTSLGGMKLGNYLAREGEMAKKNVLAAIIISACFDWVKGNESLEQPGLNRLINYHMASSLVEFLRNVRHHFKDFMHLDHALSSKTIRDFDSRFTSRQFGYPSMKEYYAGVSLIGKLDRIRVPLLALNAADDPVQPLDSLPINEVEKSKFVSLVVTKYGGHIGFLEGALPFGDYFSSRLLQLYLQHILQSQ